MFSLFLFYIVKYLLLGLNHASCARLFNLDESTLFRAQQKEDRVITNMKLSPVPRDKGEEHYELLMKYFETISPKSGKFFSH